MILIDIGNTRIKWASFIAGQLGTMHALNHTEQGFSKKLVDAWQKTPSPDKIYLASVGPVTIKQNIIHLTQVIWPEVIFQEVHTQKKALGVNNAYRQYQKLGVDRWLSILAAYHYFHPPVCIISCGTAITLDIIDQHGQHLGGMIMPGFNLLKNALSKGTANLGLSIQNYPLGLSCDTESAIYNGNLNAVKGFIEFGLASYHQPLPLILTGGDAQFFQDALKLRASVDSQLVMKGLCLIAGEKLV